MDDDVAGTFRQALLLGDIAHLDYTTRGNEVGRCRLPVSKPELKARLVSTLETKM
jgi:hypothetical protein